MNLPDYGGGASAPNFTALPDIRAGKLRWFQHFDFDVSARALVNRSGGVETNTANAVQVELVGTCDPDHRASWGRQKAGTDYLYWPDAPDWALAELARFVRWAHDHHGVRLESTVVWKAYPGSYGANGVRLTGAQWGAYYGWLGHQHVPENCVHPETPVLCADLVWRPAGELRPGDGIVAFDEETVRVAGANGGRRYRRGVVTRNEPAVKDCYRVTTTQGSVVASADHPWLVRLPYVHRGSRIAWVASRDLDPVKHRVISLGAPWRAEDTRIAGWLAGVLDADGHAFAGGHHGSRIGFGQVDGRVVDLFLAECDRRGWTTKVIRRDWKTRRTRPPGREPEDVTDVRINGGLWESCRILGTLRPERLLSTAAAMWEGAVVGKTTGDVAVLGVEHLGDQPIASLSTDTHTYVAAGLLCHNSHGDPGALDFARVLEHARGTTRPHDPTPPEDSDMPRFLSLGVTKESKLRPKEWQHLVWDTEFSDPLGQHAAGAAVFATRCQYNGVVHVRLRDVTPGALVQVRLAEDDGGKNTVVRHPVAEVTGRQGTVSVALPVSGQTGEDRHVKVQVAQFGDAPATIEACYLKAQVWAA
ncbi:hypothetical protein RKE29_07955 [Streptomyces sp. B1866]|nr:hypothetical protein [Streptomyces sp. B1866]